MRTFDRLHPSRRSRRAFPVIAAVCLLFACASSHPGGTGRIELQDGTGFVIHEQVRVNSSVRKDFERAVALIGEEQFDEGIALLERVVEDAPDLTTAHLNLGIAHGLAGDFERAEDSLETALQLHPRHPVAHNELGIVYRKTGRFEEARASYQEALAVYPDFHFARRNLAILCDVYVGDAGCALENYALYTKVVPEDEAVAMWLTDLRNRMGK